MRNIEHVTDVKKVQISGLPLELGLKADVIKDEFNARLREKYPSDKDIIKAVNLILAQNSVAVELESKSDIPKIKETFEGLNLLGQELHVTSFEDKTINFNVTGTYDAAASTSNPIANTAQTTAQAAAIAKAALEQLQGEDSKAQPKIEATDQSKCRVKEVGTRILKVWNMINPIYFHTKSNELRDLQLDIKAEFETFGKIKDIRMVMPDTARLGAEPGSLFVEYTDTTASKIASEELKKRKFDTKEIKRAYVKESMYENYFKQASNSFINLVDLAQEPMQYPIQTQIPAQAGKEADYEFE